MPSFATRRGGRRERALDLGRLGRRRSGVPKIGWLWLLGLKLRLNIGCGGFCGTYVEGLRKETEKEISLMG